MHAGTPNHAFPARTLAAFLAVLAAVSAAGCSRIDGVREADVATLSTNLQRARDLEVLTPSGRDDGQLVRALIPAIERLGSLGELHRYVPGSGPRTPRVAVAVTPLDGLFASFARRAGVEPRTDGRTGFTYASQAFEAAHDAVVATFEDPDRPGLPLTLVVGNSARAALAAAGTLEPGWKPWVNVYRSGERVLAGPIGRDGTPRPPELARVGFARVALESVLVPIVSSAPGVLGRRERGLDESELARYLASCVRARERVVGWCAPGAGIPAVEVAVWANADGYAFDGDPDQLSRFDPVDEVVSALILRDGDRALDDGGAGAARAGAWNRLGAPRRSWMLDAAGVEAAWWWWGHDLDAWLARTGASGGELPLARLTADACGEDVSAHVLVPRRAALWRYWRETRGDEFVRAVWTGAQVIPTGAADDAAFTAWLAGRVGLGRAAVEAERADHRRARSSSAPWRGVCVVDPPDDAPWVQRAPRGRIRAAREPLPPEVGAVGANAVAFHAFLRDTSGASAQYADPRAHRLATRAGDVRVVADLLAADARALEALFVPHVLAGDGGTWAGTWTRGDQEDWAAFFERYARLLEHAGCLAQLGHARILSLGSGLWAVTNGELHGRRVVAQETTWRAAGWKKVVATARSAFDGALTYSAGNLGELSQVSFFGDLDYVGLEIAPALDVLAPRDAGEARGQVANYVDASLLELERASLSSGKPALVTQLAFRPELHGAARVQAGQDVSTAWQAQQFREAGVRFAAHRGSLPLAGVFVWRAGREGFVSDHDVRIGSPDAIEAVRALLDGIGAAAPPR